MIIKMDPINGWVADQVANLVEDISVDRENNLLKIKRVNTGEGVAKLAFWNWHYDYTYYNLAGWSGRYGKPFELLLSLHLATMAPDLVYEIAMNEDLDAKVNIKQKDIDFKCHIEVDGKTIDELEEEENDNGEKVYSEETISKLRELEGSGVIKTKTLYIESVKNHWFRDVYFDSGDNQVTVGKVVEEEEEQEEGDEEEEEESNSDEEKDDIEYEYTQNEDGSRELVTENKKINVYEDGDDVEDSMEYNGEDIPGLEGAQIVLKGTRSGDMKQVADGVRGVTNKTTKELFNKEYYIYDGTVQNANNIKNGNAEKQAISMNKDSLSAFAMLEETDSIDAQLIYRDLKELVIELGYFDKEDFDEIEKECMEWPIPDYPDSSWPYRKWEKQVLEYGTLIRSKSSVEELNEQEAEEEGESTEEENQENTEDTEENEENAENDTTTNDNTDDKDTVNQDNNKHYKVALNAGHGLDNGNTDGGATSADGSVNELMYTPKVAEKAQEYLEEYGIEVIQVGGMNYNLQDRLSKAKEADVDLLVGIHYEYSGGASGVFCCYNSSSSDESHNLGDLLKEKVSENMGLSTRSDTVGLGGAGGDSFVAIGTTSNSDFPSVYVEGGSLGPDLSVITSDEGVDGYAKGIAEGILEYLNVTEKTGTTTEEEEKPPEGFEPGLDIIAMIDSEVTDIIDETTNEYASLLQEGVHISGGGLKLKITQECIIKDYTLVIFGFDVASEISTGQELVKGEDIIGTTNEGDICMILIDKDRAVVENIEDYVIRPKSGGKLKNVTIQDDYDVSDEAFFVKNVEQFKELFSNYTNITDNAQAFIDMQEKYGVNAVFCACATIVESSGGTNWAAIPSSTYNWLSISGSYNGSSVYTNREWRNYPSFAACVDDFGDLIKNAPYYYKNNKKTVSEIATSYCGTAWGESVNQFMTDAYEKINESNN